jgi:hypothetical protein
MGLHVDASGGKQADYACPIPDTHDKFEEAHYFLHRAILDMKARRPLAAALLSSFALVGVISACGSDSASADHSAAIEAQIRNNEDVTIDSAGWTAANVTAAHCTESGSSQNYQCQISWAGTISSDGFNGTGTAQLPAVCDTSGKCQLGALSSVTVHESLPTP